jgi:glyoxalase family protein
MGMRLVKRTVNQDDVSAYHLFYADQVATPGTDITFFDWNVPRERRGTRSVINTGFRVSGRGALAYWLSRFKQMNVNAGDIIERDGRLCLNFEDPEGQRLSLVDDGSADGTSEYASSVSWTKSPVPAEHQVRGLGPITLSVPELTATHEILTGVMNLRPVRQYGLPEGAGSKVYVYQMDARGPQAELHVAVQPDLERVRPGAGGVHHVAFRTPDEREYHLWQKRLNEFRVANSGEIDRFYFRSLYFREPGGVLFEIATDGPGFGVDEDMETLGEKVALPPFLEPRRAQILANLKPID